MRRALLAVSALIVPSVLSAQLDPCGPAIIGAPSSNTDLNAANLGGPVKQIFVVRHPGANPPATYLGCATIRPAAQTNDDVIMFTWNGIGTVPTVLNPNPAAIFNTGADDFQLSITPDGLTAVADTGTNAGEPKIATRTSLAQPFGNLASLVDTRVSAPFTGYIDPQLAIVDGNVVLYWAEAVRKRIRIGNPDINPSSATYGQVANIHSAVEPITRTGFNNWHSPTPVVDAGGLCRALVLSAAMAGSGSDAYYQSGADARDFPVSAIRPQMLNDDGTDWLANPANVAGTALFADAVGANYGDPRRIDYFAVNSVSITTAGGPVVLVTNTPAGSPVGSVFVNIGLPLPTPIDPNTLGFPAYGNLCVSALVAIPAVVTNNSATVQFNAPAGVAAGTVLSVESLALDTSTGRLWLSNMAVLEVR